MRLYLLRPFRHCLKLAVKLQDAPGDFRRRVPWHIDMDQKMLAPGRAPNANDAGTVKIFNLNGSIWVFWRRRREIKRIHCLKVRQAQPRPVSENASTIADL